MMCSTMTIPMKVNENATTAIGPLMRQVSIKQGSHHCTATNTHSKHTKYYVHTHLCPRITANYAPKIDSQLDTAGTIGLEGLCHIATQSSTAGSTTSTSPANPLVSNNSTYTQKAGPLSVQSRTYTNNIL